MNHPVDKIPAVLTASRLSRPGRKPDTWLLREVSLAIQPGDRIAIVGHSGSGKTLLLRALAQLDAVQSGEVHWQSAPVEPVAVPEFRSQVCYLQQRPAMAEGTVETNLQMPFRLGIHRDRSYDGDDAQRLFNQLGRDAGFLRKQSSELSGGELQIASLVRALLLAPRILLLDEPTAALDSVTTQLVETLLAGWVQQAPDSRAIVWVTHDLAQAERVADRVLHMEAGCLGTLDGAELLDSRFDRA